MHFHCLPLNEWIAAVAVGLATGAALLFIMIPLTLAGITPVPKRLPTGFFSQCAKLALHYGMCWAACSTLRIWYGAGLFQHAVENDVVRMHD